MMNMFVSKAQLPLIKVFVYYMCHYDHWMCMYINRHAFLMFKPLVNGVVLLFNVQNYFWKKKSKNISLINNATLSLWLQLFSQTFLHKIYTCKKWNQLSRYDKKEQDMICKLNQHAITIMLYYYNVPVITYVFPLSSCTPHAADEVAVCIHTLEYLNGLVNPPCENWSMKVQEILVLMHRCKRY